MPAKHRDKILFFLNGVRTEIGADLAGTMLADYLRDVRRLTGTKIVCAEGDCGACTVLRFFPGAGPRKLGRSEAFTPVNSCITPLFQLDGSSLVTVDALADGEKLHPAQEAMKACHGSQCGFCTPGFVMALAGLVEKKRARDDGEITERDARNSFTGNLCRCTGYQQILDAARSVKPASCTGVGERFYSEAQEMELRKALAAPLFLESASFEAFAPLNLRAGAAWLAKRKDARVLASATDLGVVHNKGKIHLARLLSLHLIPELYELKTPARGAVLVGARVTLSELRRALKERSPETARFLDLFASPQIKNIATLVGNVANASPIADTPPFLLACDAVVHVEGPRGKRKVPLAEFYLDYRKTALKKGELVRALEFTPPVAGERFAIYKVSERKDLDISCVNAGLRLRQDAKGLITEARVAFGGVAATPVRLKRTEKTLVGEAPSAALLTRATSVLQEEIQPISDVRGSSAFRRVLAGNLLKRFFREHLEVASS
jgi:xanthine dehydrogenase small subunit